jgi:hypothetical protein
VNERGAAIERLLRRTRTDRGLPESVDDDATLANIAALIHQGHQFRGAVVGSLSMATTGGGR